MQEEGGQQFGVGVKWPLLRWPIARWVNNSTQMGLQVSCNRAPRTGLIYLKTMEN